jgi:signal transduction histidine kinase
MTRECGPGCTDASTGGLKQAGVVSGIALAPYRLASRLGLAHRRAELNVLAEEQAALRRVATLVARGVPADTVFAAIAEEVGRLVPSIDRTAMLRYEADGTATLIAGWTEAGIEIEIGSRLRLEGKNILALVLQTGRPARIDDYANATGELAAILRKTGVRSAAGAPIVVDGRMWGVMVAASVRRESMPVGTESRIAEFTELLGAAISNAQSRADLAASRARVVAASDETRRRIERDLHDGAQQQLVSLVLELRTVAAAMPDDAQLRVWAEHTANGLTGVLDDLREISQGIHPAIVARGGLGPALRALACRSAVPVELDMRVDRRLPEWVEVAAYYVLSEALTNAAKHANASVVHVEVEVDESVLELAIRDDGAGGADPSRGSGLIGLGDRVQALGGSLELASPVGLGTSLLIRIPLKPPLAAPGGEWAVLGSNH